MARRPASLPAPTAATRKGQSAKAARPRPVKAAGKPAAAAGRRPASAAAAPPLFLTGAGLVDIGAVARRFGMAKAQLAETVGVAPETFQRSARASAPKTQTRLREMLEIVHRVTDWAGGPLQAMAWYRAQPIPSFGGRTAESLVRDGHAAAVRDHLDRIALGGFA